MEVRIAGDGLAIATDSRWLGQTLAAALQTEMWLPGAYTKRLFAEGRVQVGRQPASPELVITRPLTVRLLGGVDEPYGLGSPMHASVPAASPLWEDEHAMVMNKPAGLIIYPSSESDVDTLGLRVARYYELSGQLRKVRHVHRLDKDTTGAVLYAKHSYSARALDALLTEGRIERIYWALTLGKPRHKTGVIDQPIGRDRHVSGRYRVSRTGKPAKTLYRTLGTVTVGGGHLSLLECRLATGRTHQIRVHLSSIGCPIVGDTLYGGLVAAGWPAGQGFALHAKTLAFYHPYLREPMVVEAPLPDSFAGSLRRIGISV
ncbi:pseudouridine synthase [Alicyclobacillus contaminans]|uniref:RluA family pseudouridine synthase n=1 Tax=Alicyclobacillus contaminans TaxID=392016 RepID=UPI00041DD44B|nr:RluA family pseudouridine synthase [Alicyclobacillus contaminans]GMA49604.1 pseudouridine synthase [Alicyclobacillus contaminans]